MLVFVAQDSRVYPLVASVIMSYTSRHVLNASVNKQNKEKMQKSKLYLVIPSTRTLTLIQVQEDCSKARAQSRSQAHACQARA